MNTAGMLAEAFDRVGETVHAAVEGLTPDDLNARVDARANSISWLIWHLTRVQDDHIADAAGTGQIWLTEGWADRFGLPFDGTATGYGHSSAEVAAVRVDSAEPLLGYFDAARADPGLRRGTGGPRPRPDRRRGLVAPGDARGPADQRHRGGPPARGPGRLRPRAAGTRLNTGGRTGAAHTRA